jgi:hypothetical protein
MDKPKNKPGRKSLNGSGKSTTICERVSDAQKAKYVRLGKGKFLRSAIDAAKEPKV